MSFLQSSLFGKDFVNYRKNNAHYERTKFSSRVRNANNIPVVIDSVDKTFSTILSNEEHKNGKEYILNPNNTIDQFMLQIEQDINELSPSFLDGKKIKLGLEDGTFLTTTFNNVSIDTMYKKYKNQNDNILYFLVTHETTMYGYIISILKYLGIF